MSEVISPDIIDVTDTLLDKVNQGINLSQNNTFNITNYELLAADKNSLFTNDDRECTEELKTKAIIETVGPILDEYNKKFNLNFKMESFSDTLKFIASIDKNTRQLKEIIDAQLITDLCQIVIVKSIMTLSYLITTQLDNVMSSQYVTELNPTTCQVVNSVFMWVDKLETLRDKYTQYDIDKKIKLLKESSSDSQDSGWMDKLFEVVQKSYKGDSNDKKI